VTKQFKIDPVISSRNPLYSFRCHVTEASTDGTSLLQFPACILPSAETLLSEGQCSHGFVNPVLGIVIYFHDNFMVEAETGALIS
jgi:hypothetical protein